MMRQYKIHGRLNFLEALKRLSPRSSNDWPITIYAMDYYNVFFCWCVWSLSFRLLTWIDKVTFGFWNDNLIFYKRKKQLIWIYHSQWIYHNITSKKGIEKTTNILLYEQFLYIFRTLFVQQYIHYHFFIFICYKNSMRNLSFFLPIFWINFCLSTELSIKLSLITQKPSGLP